METLGVVSPGAMGSAMADALARGGARVVATLAGRSQRTSRLAAAVPLQLLPDLATVVREADVVLSIVPPEAARTVAYAVATAVPSVPARAALRRSEPRRRRAALLVELNAISPATAREIAATSSEACLEVVDGSISGPPPWEPGTTRVYLSGRRAHEVAALPFAGVDVIVVGDEVGAASAVKMSTASVYKGTTALLAHALLAAHANGVLDHVLADLCAAAPELVAGIERRLALAAAKAHRYVGEMREIAATQEEARLTPALFEALARVYEGIAETPLARSSPEDVPPGTDLEDVLSRLRG